MNGAHRALLGVACVVGVLAESRMAWAQSAPRPVTVGLAVGGTVPLSDFANDTKTGINGGAFVQYEPSRGIWGVRGEVGYHRSQLTDEALSAVGALPDDKVNNGIVTVGATALLIGNKRDRSVTPYLVGGLGLYRLTVSRTSGSSSQGESANGFGFSGGAGVRLGRSTGLFAEVRFHQFSITPDGSTASSSYQMIPVTIGLRF